MFCTPSTGGATGWFSFQLQNTNSAAIAIHATLGTPQDFGRYVSTKPPKIVHDMRANSTRAGAPIGRATRSMAEGIVSSSPNDTTNRQTMKIHALTVRPSKCSTFSRPCVFQR